MAKAFVETCRFCYKDLERDDCHRINSEDVKEYEEITKIKLVPSFSLSALCCHPCIREIKLITRKIRRFIGNEKYLQNSLEKEPRREKEPESDQIFKDEDDVPALNRNANHRGLDREGLSAARSKRSRTVGSLDTPENRMKQLKVLFSEAPFQMNGKFVCDFPKCKKVLKTMKGILAHKKTVHGASSTTVQTENDVFDISSPSPPKKAKKSVKFDINIED